MVAQDIQGMGEEIAGLRDLGRLLIEMQRQAVDAAELAALIDIYSLSAVRLGEMVQAQKEIQERRPEDSWAEQLLAVLVESARRDGEDIDIDTAREMALAGDADAQSAALRLMEEIAATRLGLRRAYHLVMQSDDVHDRIHLVDIYGRACHRLSRLLKMDGVELSRLEAIMNDLIEQVTAEVAEEFGLV